MLPGLWFRVRASEFRIQVSRLELKDYRFMVLGSGCRGWGLGCMVEGSGFIV